MGKFVQITKKYFCDALCRDTSILVNSGMAKSSFLEDRFDDIVDVCESIDVDNETQRIGKMRSNFIEFTTESGETSRLGFDQKNTKYEFFNHADIFVCKQTYMDEPKSRYTLYRLV